MKKEIIICIIVIIAIVILNIITQNYTNYMMQELTNDLGKVEAKLLDEDDVGAMESINEVSKKWDNVKNNFAYYIEHDELEKVELYIINTESNVKVKEYNTAIEAVNDCIFIMSHIKDKYKFTFQNIF